MASKGLMGLLEESSGTEPEPVPEKKASIPIPTPTAARAGSGDAVFQIAGIEVEAVVGGALQRITFGPGTNPAQVADLLRSLDPAAKVRDAFPMKQMGGNREVKTGVAYQLSVKSGDSGVFWDLSMKAGDEAISCSVSKKNSGEFLAQLEKLGRLTDKSLAKLAEAVAAKKGTPVIVLLDPGESFTVKYWLTDDGKAFLDSVEAGAPAEGVGYA